MKKLSMLMLMLLIVFSISVFSQDRVDDEKPKIINSSITLVNEGSSLVKTWKGYKRIEVEPVIVKWSKKDGEWVSSDASTSSGFRVIEVIYKDITEKWLLIYTTYSWYKYPNLQIERQSRTDPTFFKLTNELESELKSIDSLTEVNLGTRYHIHSSNNHPTLDTNDQIATTLLKYYNGTYHKDIDENFSLMFIKHKDVIRISNGAFYVHDRERRRTRISMDEYYYEIKLSDFMKLFENI